MDLKTRATITGFNCDGTSKPYYNARTISTGAEVSLWAWQQYLATDDKSFLQRMYPLMRAATTFLLAYETDGPDGRRHTQPSNAHETQWDVADPTTDLAARKTLYPVMIQAATILGQDASLIKRLRDELMRIPSFPLSIAGQQTPATEAEQFSVLADSWTQGATRRNFENIGLEPVWPYGLLGLSSTPAELKLARQTYQNRPSPINQEWSYDPLQAARLGLGQEVSTTLHKLTVAYQHFPNGMANWGGDAGEFYLEQSGIVAAALAEAAVQDYDGIVRVAPALPAAWSVTARVAVQHGTRIDVEAQNGAARTVVIEAGPHVRELSLINSWKDAEVEVWSGRHLQTHLKGTLLHIPLTPEQRYMVKPVYVSLPAFAAISGEPATAARHIDDVSIGLEALKP